jgi:hypothetical protein
VKEGPLNFDLSDLTFMDSTGLRAFLHIGSALTSGCLVLHGVQQGVRRVFELSGLELVPNLHIIACSLVEREVRARVRFFSPGVYAGGAREFSLALPNGGP